MVSRSAAVVGVATPSSSAITRSVSEADRRSHAKQESRSLLQRCEFVIIPPPIAQGLSNVPVVSNLLLRVLGLTVPKGSEVTKVLRRDDE
jgi:hypothetical protein